MKVKEILLRKGEEVKTVERTEPFDDLTRHMKRANVGALMVRTQAGGLAGVIAERDIVRTLADFGVRAHSLTAEQVMAPAKLICSPNDTLRRVASLMTTHKTRHLPVIWKDRLVGVVSLGDVVKHRLDEIELEASVLRDLAANNTPIIT